MLDEGRVLKNLLFYQLEDGTYSTLELVTAGEDAAAVLIGWIVLIFRKRTASKVTVGFVWVP